jgi:hypothetical protein
MPQSGKLPVAVWKIRFREKWNMVKIDDPNEPPKNRTSRRRRSSDNQRKPNPRWLPKATFLQLPPMSHQKIRPVDPGGIKSKMAAIVAILDEWQS